MANNNYDRMLLGERQQQPNIPNKAKQKRKQHNDKVTNVIKVVATVVAILLGLMLVGAMGGAVQGFMLGVFGWLGVAYCLAVVAYCTLSMAGMKPKRKMTKNKKWVVAGLIVMVFIIMLLSHLWSSHAAYEAVELEKGTVSYGDYLGQVYHHGIETSGGVLLSLFAYPFLYPIGLRISGVILAVLFFAILSAIIYPFWLTTKEQRVVNDEPVSMEEIANAPSRLYVGTVDDNPRANRVKGRRRHQQFDYQFPNAGEESPANEPEELDLIDPAEAAERGPVDTAEQRRAQAMQILMGNDPIPAPRVEETPAPDADNPLQFGTRQSTHSDWGRPAPSAVPRDQMPESQRRQQSYDILFGDAPVPTGFAQHTPRNTSASPTRPASGLAAGDTVETVVPSPRDQMRQAGGNATDTTGRTQGTTEGASGTPQQTIYNISDNGGYVNRPNAPRQPQPASFAQPQGEAGVQNASFVQQQRGAARQDEARQAFEQPRMPQEQSAQPNGQYVPREEVQPAAQQYAPWHTTPDEPISQQTTAQRTPVQQMPTWQSEPVAPTQYSPRGNTEGNNMGLLFGNRPLMPEDADRVTPNEYATFEEDEEDGLDAALHAVQDDYEEEEYEEDDQEEPSVEEPQRAPVQQAPVYQTPVQPEPVVPLTQEQRQGFIDRSNEQAPMPTFGGFVQRQVEDTPLVQPTPQRQPRTRETRPDVRPRFTAVPDESTREAARTFAPAQAAAEPKKVARPYTPPPLSLLKDYPPPEVTDDLEAMSRSLEEAFARYGFVVRVIGHTHGPTYTQYAVQLAEGVQFKRVSNLGQDISRNLRLKEEISIISKVANMDAIGVEIINKTRSIVGLKPLLMSNKFRQDKKLYFVLGVDVMGEPYYCDILSGPHMLIAGSSGSGKSVCINTLLCSILFNYKPDYVKFILIDPKGGVEMGVYNDLPHNMLGKAAVTPQAAIKALDWAIEEMERRYQLMYEANVRKWSDYNDKLLAQGKQRVPYILIIIDEMAELMMTSKKIAGDLDIRIGRLTAKARASGIHVIVATQRPSVDVITGTIKNNIPTRVAFKTASPVDSKTILDRGCAEKLYGKGDMYFMSSDTTELKRLQGPFLTDDEVYEICENIRANNDCVVDEQAAAQIFKVDEEDNKPDEEERGSGASGASAQGGDDGEMGEEELFEKAVRLAAEQGFVSISRLQRMFRLGFNRAANLVDEMEARDFIEKAVPGSSKPRRVLITPEECDEIFGYTDDDYED